MDLSLDDIIKKKNIGKSSQRSRVRSQNTQGGRRNNSSVRSNRLNQSSNARIRKTSPRPVRGGITDARSKIIQRNRQRMLMSDARDKLCEKTKPIDARLKIRGRNGIEPQVESRQKRGRIGRDSARQPPVLLQRSIRNNNMRDPSSLIRCTVNRPEVDYSPRPSPMYTEDMDMSMRSRNDYNSIKVVTQNDYSHYGQEYVPEPMYVEHYDHQPVFNRRLDSPPRVQNFSRNSGARMSQEMRARLDTPSKPSAPYNYPPAPQSPPPSQGHRIVVSNLHSSVTHEDIKELFEDIGPLVTSRLVRPGTAEVIYKFQKDAKKAVEAYHNRQLDGQPMKCLLVNPRSPTSSSGVLRSNNVVAPPAAKFPSSSKSMVVPDISAIHKALFTNK